jgi:hypothetical protein
MLSGSTHRIFVFEVTDSVSVLPRCRCRKRFRLTSSYPLSPVMLKLERRQANTNNSLAR